MAAIARRKIFGFDTRSYKSYINLEDMSKYEYLKNIISEMGGAVVGYSGGVDSTLLAKAATEVLGEKALCVLIESCLMPKSEIDEAIRIAKHLGLNLVRITVDALGISGVPENSPERCYHCKKALFGKLAEIAKERGLAYVLDGSNASDKSDFRPGSIATKELGVRSPFIEVGMTKEDIRSISRELKLPTWNKPSYACLASRVPYGTRLTNEVLNQIESAEDILRKLGFGQCRVRHHGVLARIEFLPEDMHKALQEEIRQKLIEEIRNLGFKYIALDLEGYRTGSMNESLR